MTRPALRDIPVHGIRDTGSPYRFRSHPEDVRLTRSIKENGLLSPVGVVADGTGFILMYGFRRFTSVCSAGLQAIPCMVFDPFVRQADALPVILADNRGGAMDVMDRAGLLAMGQKLTGMDDRAYVAAWKDLTGETVGFRELMLSRTLAQADTEIQEAVRTGTMPPVAAGMVAKLDPDDRKAILRVTVQGGLDLSRSGYEEFLLLAGDIAAREQIRIGDVLHEPEIKTVTGEGTMTPQQKGARLLAVLRHRRYPAYARDLAHYEKEKTAAERPFGGRARFSTPRFFEKPVISLSLSASGAEELTRMLSHYTAYAESGKLDSMFRLAGGECP